MDIRDSLKRRHADTYPLDLLLCACRCRIVAYRLRSLPTYFLSKTAGPGSHQTAAALSILLLAPSFCRFASNRLGCALPDRHGAATHHFNVRHLQSPSFTRGDAWRHQRGLIADPRLACRRLRVGQIHTRPFRIAYRLFNQSGLRPTATHRGDSAQPPRRASTTDGPRPRPLRCPRHPRRCFPRAAPQRLSRRLPLRVQPRFRLCCG
jgi:hypothetical protein